MTTNEKWRWRQNDLELRVHFFPAMKLGHASVEECFQLAVLWRGHCIGVIEMKGTEATN